MAKLSLRDLREGVASADGELRSDSARCARGRQNDLRAGDDVIWIGDRGVGGEQFTPAETLAEILFGEFPERVAALDGHYISFRGLRRSEGCGWSNGRESNCRRSRGGRQRRRSSESSWAAERRALHWWLIRGEARRGGFGRWRK